MVEGSAARGTSRFINTERSRGPSRLLAFRPDGKAALASGVVVPFPQAALAGQSADFVAEIGFVSGRRYSRTARTPLCVVHAGCGIPLSKEKQDLIKQIAGGLFPPTGMPSAPPSLGC
jgi:hypothetical protein